MADNHATFVSETDDTPAVRATAFAKGASGIFSQSTGEGTETIHGEHLVTSGSGVLGIGGPDGGYGVEGRTKNNWPAVRGTNEAPPADQDPNHRTPGAGVEGDSLYGVGVMGVGGSYGVSGSGNTGVQGVSRSDRGVGVYGENEHTAGVVGVSTNIGVSGVGYIGDRSGTGVAGFGGARGTGVSGQSGDGVGVHGDSSNIGVSGTGGPRGTGVYGFSVTVGNEVGFGTGVKAYSKAGTTVYAETDPDEDPDGADSVALIADAPSYAFAAKFHGPVKFYASLTAEQIVATALVVPLQLLKIDHPLDPANRYLYHAGVESSERKTIYDGIVELDAHGEAVIELPDWFEALNGAFRYQLTCIGAFAPVYIAEELTHNRVKIAGGHPGLKVSWQVTGVRHDPVARANPMAVEADKPVHERGSYQNPEAHGQPAEKGLHWERDDKHRRRLEQLRLRPVIPPSPEPPRPLNPPPQP